MIAGARGTRLLLEFALRLTKAPSSTRSGSSLIDLSPTSRRRRWATRVWRQCWPRAWNQRIPWWRTSTLLTL